MGLIEGRYLMACHQKHKEKTNLYKLKDFTFSKTLVFFFKILFTKLQKKNSSAKGTPFQALGFAILNWN